MAMSLPRLVSAAVAALAPLASCSQPAHTVRPPLSAGEHYAEAERHDADARALEETAAGLERTGTPTPATCGDVALNELTTSGTERLHLLPPCWSGEVATVRRARQHADKLRTDARRHRIQARELVLAQQRWCASLPEAELDHTPFDHREDLRGVTAELEGDRLRGARIRFKPVRGLSAAWLRQTLACHQALAAAEGYASAHLAACPSAVAHAITNVEETPAGLEVVIRSDDAATALVIYGRAEALLGNPVEPDEPAAAP
jgi:hypothetical protein